MRVLLRKLYPVKVGLRQLLAYCYSAQLFLRKLYPVKVGLRPFSLALASLALAQKAISSESRIKTMVYPRLATTKDKLRKLYPVKVGLRHC